jgi:hypothetical protein
MFRALAALKRRVIRRRGVKPRDGGAQPLPQRREPTRMELDLYGAIVGKRLGDGAANPDAPPPGVPRRNVHIPLSLRRRPWWRKTPAWVWDHCRALLNGAEQVFPISKRARAAWLEICRRLTRERSRGTGATRASRSKRK